MVLRGWTHTHVISSELKISALLCMNVTFQKRLVQDVARMKHLQGKLMSVAFVPGGPSILPHGSQSSLSTQQCTFLFCSIFLFTTFIFVLFPL